MVFNLNGQVDRVQPDERWGSGVLVQDTAAKGWMSKDNLRDSCFDSCRDVLLAAIRSVSCSIRNASIVSQAVPCRAELFSERVSQKNGDALEGSQFPDRPQDIARRPFGHFVCHRVLRDSERSIDDALSIL